MTVTAQYFRNGVPISIGDALDELGTLRDGVSVRTRITLIDGLPQFTGDAQAFAASPAGRAAVARAERNHYLQQRYLGDRARPFTDAQAADAVTVAMTAAATPATIGDAAQISHLQGARIAAQAMRNERLRTAYLPTNAGGR